jgi:hypothetical protein
MRQCAKTVKTPSQFENWQPKFPRHSFFNKIKRHHLQQKRFHEQQRIDPERSSCQQGSRAAPNLLEPKKTMSSLAL